MHILFVDDIEDTRELYSFIFEREGFTMAIASDGMEALKAIQNSEQPFDIVVMDIDMPQVNGWQAVGAIRELPQGKHLPIILFTAHSWALRAQSVEVGANAILYKPATADQILEVIWRVLEQSNSDS